MTTVNSAIFSNLSGASPSLLSRALELINNSKLNTLETLRQSLSSGELIIRTITDADNISPRAHASLVNPEIDQVTKLIVKPGVVLVRSENLVSASDHG